MTKRIERRDRKVVGRRAFARGLVAPCLGALTGGCGPCRRSKGPSSTPSHIATIDVDFDSVAGPFTRLSGVQGSPVPVVPEDSDHRDRFRDYHVEHARFPQDCPPNTLTLAAIFPNGDADPERPESYRFEAIDRHIEAARSAGTEILWQSSYDVGRTDRWMGMNLGGRAPVDLRRWARVVERCLEHFNNGWAGGFDGAVRNIEFVNEPNGLGGFGGPHMRRLIPSFEAFLRMVAQYNQRHPTTLVRAVGPGIPFALPDWRAWKPRFENLFRSLRSAGLDLPVLSFHTYGRDTSPQANATLAKEYRALLDRHGMKNTELWNSEWQGGAHLKKSLGDVRRPLTQELRRLFGAGLATYALSCKIRWQGIVQRAYYYRANMRAFPDEPKFRPRTQLGFATLFSMRGEVMPLALQEKLTHLIAKRTPLRCKTSYREESFLTALGLRSQEPAQAGVLLCNLAKTPQKVKLQLSGVGTGDGDIQIAETVLHAESEDLVERTLSVRRPKARKLELEATVGGLSSQVIWLG